MTTCLYGSVAVLIMCIYAPKSAKQTCIAKQLSPQKSQIYEMGCNIYAWFLES